MKNRHPDILIQLYSVHEHLRADYAGTLGRLHDAGVRNAELFWFDGQPPVADMQRMFTDSGIRPMAMHVNFDVLSRSLPKVIDACRTLSVRDVVLPWIAPEMRAADGFWRSFGRQLNKFGSELQLSGIAFGYHNHDFEFAPVAPELPMQVLLDTTDAALVFWEMDTFWVEFAGQNVLDWMARCGDRIRAIHFKDGRDRRMVELGSGELPWTEIFQRLSGLNTKYWILEQEEFPTGDPWRELANGLEFLAAHQ